MRQFNKITIIGVGLIGGSIGMAIRKKKLAKVVTGVFRHKSTLRKALKCKAVDSATMDIKEGVKDADLIILASPVYSIPVLAKEVIKHAKDGAIITDVGSTKSWVVDRLEKMLKRRAGLKFVGSHPMAGSEHAGVEFAKDDLLEDAPCIVTKTAHTDRKALNIVSGFWASLGTKVTVMSPSKHDKVVSLISHLPHIVAFSLAGAVPVKAMACAAEGFKDTTRVASSDPKLWADIFLTNRNEVVKAAKIFERSYKNLIKALSANDYSGTVKFLKRSKAKRDKFVYGKS